MTPILRRYIVTALLAGLSTACQTSEPTPEPVPWRTDVIEGVPAVSTPGQEFTIVIRLGERDGTPVPDWPLNWSGDGRIEVINEHSDAFGLARAVWTLPRFNDDYQFDYGGGPSGKFSLNVSAGDGVGHTIVTEAAVAKARGIDATFSYGCGIQEGGLFCWGRNIVLHPSGTFRYAREPLPDGVVPELVRTGFHILCILDQQGSSWCTRAADSGTWHKVGGAPPLAQLNIGGEPGFNGSVCGLAAADGMLWCWPVRGTSTTATATGFGPFVAISGKSDATCALDPDQLAWCWGQNRQGQLGDGTTSASAIPVRVAGDHRFDRIAAGNEMSCGRATDGKIWCWGAIGFTRSSTTPTLVDDPWSAGAELVVGYDSDLYLRKDGQVRVWADGRMWDELDYSAYNAVEFVAYGHACLRQINDEIYCSIDMVHPLIMHPIFTAPLTAVPIN